MAGRLPAVGSRGCPSVVRLSLLLAWTVVFTLPSARAMESFLLGKANHQFWRSAVGRDGTIYVLAGYNKGSCLVRYDRNGAPLDSVVGISSDAPKHFVYARHKADEEKDRLYVVVQGGRLLKCTLGCVVESSVSLGGDLTVTDIAYSDDRDEILVYGEASHLQLAVYGSDLVKKSEVQWQSASKYDATNVTADPTGQIYTGYTDHKEMKVKKFDGELGELIEKNFDVKDVYSDETSMAVQYSNGFVYSSGFLYDKDEKTDDGLIVRMDTLLERPLTAVVRGTPDVHITNLSTDPEGNIYAVGTIGEGQVKFLNGTTIVPEADDKKDDEYKDEMYKFADFAVPGSGFFVAKLDKDLQWKWVLLPSETMPLLVFGLQVDWNEINQRLMVTGTIIGEMKLGTTTVGAPLDFSALDLFALPATGFLAVVNPDGTMADKVRLEVRAEANVTKDDSESMQVQQDVEQMLSPILPFRGRDLDLIKGTEVVAEVPKLLYFDANDQIIRHPDEPEKSPPTEQQIRTSAEKRFESTGYAVEGEPIQGTASTYKFEIEDDTTLVFNWDVDYALVVSQNLDGTCDALDSGASGNPTPEVKKHWIRAQEIITAEIDGVVDDMDVDNIGRRFLPYGYWAGGAADPANKSTGRGNILGTVPPLSIATSGGTQGSKATATLPSSDQTNDRLLFTSDAPGSAANGQIVTYVGGIETTDTATVSFAGNVLTVTVNEGYTTANTVRDAVNDANAVDPDATPFVVETMDGSDGTAPMYLHGGQSATLAGGDDGLPATAVVPSPAVINIMRGGLGGELEFVFEEADDPTAVGASFDEEADQVLISVELGTTTLNDVVSWIEALERDTEVLFYPSIQAGDGGGTVDLLPETVTMDREEEEATVYVLADYAIRVTTRGLGPETNDVDVRLERLGWGSPVSVDEFGDTVQLTINTSAPPTVQEVVDALNDVDGVTGDPLYIVMAELPDGVSGTTQYGTTFLDGSTYDLSGGRGPRAAEAEFVIDHTDHSELVVEANEFAESVYVEGCEDEVPLRGVKVETVDDGSVIGNVARVEYEFGETLTVKIDAGTTSLEKVIEAVNEHANASLVFAAMAADGSDGTGLLTPAADETVGGTIDTADTVAYMVERLDGVVFEAGGDSDVTIEFVQVDAPDPTPVFNAATNTLTFKVVLDLTTLGDIQQRAQAVTDAAGAPLFSSVALTGDTDPDCIAFPDPTSLNLHFSGGALSRRAYLPFNPPGKDNELTFVARQMGEHGNNFSLELVEDDSVPEDSPQIAFNGNLVTIRHSPDGATANSVRDAVERYTKSNPSFPIEVSRDGFYLFPGIESRQKLRQFVMDRPGTIAYEWKTQYRVQMSTSSSKSEEHPYIQVQLPKGFQEDSMGSGEFWYDSGTHLMIGTRFRGGKQQLVGWNAGSGHMPLDGTLHDLKEVLIDGAEYRMLEIKSLSRGTSVQWDYGDRIFDQRITIGNPVDVSMIEDAQKLATGDEYLSLTVYLDTKPETVTIVNGPAGSTADNVQVWDDVADIFYPLRPSTYQIEWPTSDPEQVVISRVTCGYADAPVPGTLTYSISPDDDAILLRYQVISDTGGARLKTFAVLTPTSPDVELSRLRVRFSDSGSYTNTATASYSGDLLSISLNHGITTGQSIVNAINTGGPVGAFPYTASTEELEVLPIGERFPGEPKPWTHVTNVVDGEADIAPVDLEPSDNDAFHFQSLGYTESDALVSGTQFTAASAGYSTLVFSKTVDGGGASGDLTKEVLHVRTVRTKYWYDGMDGGNALVGSKITSAYDTAGLGTGAVVHRLARYNVYIHDRLAAAGPIIPVNQHFTGKEDHDLVVVWYENHLHEPQINWPYQTVKYDVSWPDTSHSNGYDRIVIASMLGTEGRKWVSDLDLDAGVVPEDEAVYDPELFDELSVYVQDDPATGGYNPNEEHALLASSFKSLGEANPPTAAFALRNDLNITEQDETYTSDPFTLVQYRDLVADEMKMLVYKVEKQDTRDVYEFTIPNIDFVYDYMFRLPATAGQIVLAPHPMDIVIGALPSRSTFGVDLNPNQKVYFEDHKGWPWSASGDSDEMNGVDDARFTVHFFYPLQPSFYYALDNDGDGIPQRAGEYVPWLPPKGATAEDAATTVLQEDLEPGLNVTLQVASVAGFSKGSYIGIADGGRSEYGLRVTAVSASGKTLTVERMYSPKQTGAEVSLRHTPVPVTYVSKWPDDVPTLKVGETLTFSGGEFRADHPVSRNKYGDEFTTPGLPGVVAWAAGELIFDSENPTLHRDLMGSDYSARLFPAMSTRQVEMSTGDYERSPDLLPASGNVIVDEAKYFFKGLSASLQRRVFYDPLSQKLGVFGILNDKTLGDETLTAAPPAVYVLEPNVLTPGERDSILALSKDIKWQEKVNELYSLTRDPNSVFPDLGGDKWLVGLQRDENTDELEQQQCLGVGLALVTNPALMKPTAEPGVRYVTLAENNHSDLGAAPVSLYIVRMVVADKDIPQNNPNGLAADHFRYRGALKTVLSNNVFDEKIIVRHTADFGGFADDLAFEWYYRGEDGTSALLPNMEPAKWLMFPTEDEGIGQYQISLEGTGPVIIRDNWFFMRYRHVDERFPEDPAPPADVAPYQWVGAGNSRPPDEELGELPEETYLPQLVMGWVKRVLDAINPYEARIKEFKSTESPATYVSMIQQFGQRYEGPVALNPEKNVIENVGLIELYTTVMERAKDLSIDLATPVTDGAVCNAIQLASTRIADFYMLLGNEAYADSLDPCIGFGSDSTEYGSLAPSIFTFQNQLDTLLDEELALLRGTDEYHARPVYNRLFWNFVKGEGEAAYAMSYNIQDVTRDGFIDEYDAMVMYPQGHGDAWGHYLTAIKTQYDLLNHSFFNWQARSEFYNLMDIVLDVDYRDERKFAQIAAARARVGASIVDMTYRDRYVEDPDGQWQGYTDTEENRAWGVEGWARRAGQGALFDWLAANALIPAEHPDPEADGIQEVDRSTVEDIDTIAAEFAAVETQMNAVNNGHNPLGIDAAAVPFDIDPKRVDNTLAQPSTHFGQVYDRALVALGNAQRAFNHANKLDNMLRKVANTIDQFTYDVDEQDTDYRNRLIEIFGTPYEGMIGPGKIYPEGYEGPDLILYQYVDARELSSDTVPGPTGELKAFYASFAQGIDGLFDDTMEGLDGMMGIDEVTGDAGFQMLYAPFFLGDAAITWEQSADVTYLDDSGEGRRRGRLRRDLASLDASALELDLPVTAKGYAFAAPEDWGQRACIGLIQTKIRTLLLREVDMANAINAYGGLVGGYQDMLNDLNMMADLNNVTVDYLYATKDKTKSIQDDIHGLTTDAEWLRWGGDLAEFIAGVVSEMIPDDLVFGLASGGDIMAPATAIAMLGGIAKFTMQGVAINNDMKAMAKEHELEIYNQEVGIATTEAAMKVDVAQAFQELANALGDEPWVRLDVFAELQRLSQASDDVRTVIKEGWRLVNERKGFNIKTAAVVQKHRYEDMTFRVFRNDALQKYKAAFDLAARYAYLAAKAYDYDTNLDPDHPGSAQGILKDIVAARSPGKMVGDQPVVGPPGLADLLGRLKANYDVLKSQFGIDNPQMQTGVFSLRYELFRVKREQDVSGSAAVADASKRWRETLANYRVNDLWQVSEFRRHCRPFASEHDGPQPGLVIPMPTSIVAGENFFGKPAAPGDNAFNPTAYSTRIRGVGLWFENYDESAVVSTPYVYLVPVGSDVMYIPDSNDLDVRTWHVEDQVIPVPFTIGDHELANPDWIPVRDSLSEGIAQIRRHAAFRAYGNASLYDEDAIVFDTRLIGRSAWNTRWVLIIPGLMLDADADNGLDTLIYGRLRPGKSPGGDPEADRDHSGIKDMRLSLYTYSYNGI